MQANRDYTNRIRERRIKNYTQLIPIVKNIKIFGRTIEERRISVHIEKFGNTKDEILVTSSTLSKEPGDPEFGKLPTGALGLYTCYERLTKSAIFST